MDEDIIDLIRAEVVGFITDFVLSDLELIKEIVLRI